MGHHTATMGSSTRGKQAPDTCDAHRSAAVSYVRAAIRRERRPAQPSVNETAAACSKPVRVLPEWGVGLSKGHVLFPAASGSSNC